MAISETMKRMAVAVLEGDEAAALALADAMCEGRQMGPLVLPCEVVASNKTKALVFLRDDPGAVTRDNVLNGVIRWLEQKGGCVAVMPSCVERVELYESED